MELKTGNTEMKKNSDTEKIDCNWGWFKVGDSKEQKKGNKKNLLMLIVERLFVNKSCFRGMSQVQFEMSKK